MPYDALPADRPDPARRARSVDPGATDRIARWAIEGPLSLAIGALIAVQILTWLPHYLTWPYWADHDVFATAARAWTRGLPPYRDSLCNNFPGTIYLFLGLGTLFGWGRPWTWYAFDAGVIATFGLILTLWSRRRYGRILPGLSGFLSLTSYLLGLDYCHAAQRDWQGPALGCLAILVAQGWPGRASRIGAGLLAAAGFAIRPQTLLLWPGLGVAVLLGARESQEGSRSSRALAELGASLSLGLIATFAPLAVTGVLDDFIKSVSLTAYGGPYSRVTFPGILRAWFLQLAGVRWLALPCATILLAGSFVGRAGWTATPWLLALGGVSLYKPLSPVAHSYLDVPLEVVGAVLSATLVGLIVDRAGASPALRLVGVILVLGLGGTTTRPEFCVAGPTFRALLAWGRESSLPETPPGYRRGTVATSAFYPWEDYHALLTHLATRTSPSTQVANALRGDPAITAAVDRPSAFPAESIAWLRMVRHEDEGRFAEALRRSTDSVVVWSPGEVGPDPRFRAEILDQVIETLYEPEARFGAIEVWRRRESPETLRDAGTRSRSTANPTARGVL
ncbi:MAG: hypothetical protein AB7I30_18625 [Isosphaeraceae bacterium]